MFLSGFYGLILGKFKSVEDLAASYKELEGKLGAATEEDQAETSEQEETETTESDFDAEEYYGDGLASVLEEVGIDPQEISNRFAETGEINDDDYTKDRVLAWYGMMIIESTVS